MCSDQSFIISTQSQIFQVQDSGSNADTVTAVLGADVRVRFLGLKTKKYDGKITKVHENGTFDVLANKELPPSNKKWKERVKTSELELWQQMKRTLYGGNGRDSFIRMNGARVSVKVMSEENAEDGTTTEVESSGGDTRSIQVSLKPDNKAETLLTCKLSKDTIDSLVFSNATKFLVKYWSRGVEAAQARRTFVSELETSIKWTNVFSSPVLSLTKHKKMMKHLNSAESNVCVTFLYSPASTATRETRGGRGSGNVSYESEAYTPDELNKKVLEYSHIHNPKKLWEQHFQRLCKNRTLNQKLQFLGDKALTHAQVSQLRSELRSIISRFKGNRERRTQSDRFGTFLIDGSNCRIIAQESASNASCTSYLSMRQYLCTHTYTHTQVLAATTEG